MIRRPSHLVAVTFSVAVTGTVVFFIVSEISGIFEAITETLQAVVDGVGR